MGKTKLVAICGKAGSGKDTILQIVKNQSPIFNEIISCTTRPIREREQDGVNYHFLSNEEFAQKVVDGDMLEATVFNDWCYGTALSSLNPSKINVGVFNPEGVEILSENPHIDLMVFYIIAKDKTRLLRQLNREKNPDVKEIVRRFSADEKDFNFLSNRFDYIELSNEALEDQFQCADTILAKSIQFLGSKH